jgi:tetratricopeptide (TPR) repeat protein
LNEGLYLANEQGQKSLQALGMASRGYYYLTLGMDEEGLKQAEQSFQIAQELGSPLFVMKAQAILGTAYRHQNRLQEAIKELESVHTVAHDMGFTPDEVIILYQLSRVLQRLLELAAASDMREFIARGQWLLSLLETHHQRYDAALDALVQASNLAQEIDSRLSQYLIQIQKAYVYHLSDNVPALRDALIYAERIQKKLVDNLPDEAACQAFLNNSHALQLQEIVQAHPETSV